MADDDLRSKPQKSHKLSFTTNPFKRVKRFVKGGLNSPNSSLTVIREDQPGPIVSSGSQVAAKPSEHQTPSVSPALAPRPEVQTDPQPSQQPTLNASADRPGLPTPVLSRPESFAPLPEVPSETNLSSLWHDDVLTIVRNSDVPFPSQCPASDVSTEANVSYDLFASQASASPSGVPNLDSTSLPLAPASNIPTIEPSCIIDVRQEYGDEMATREDNAKPDTALPIKEYLKLTARALKTFVTRAVDTADNNPVKVALGLVKCIIQIYDTVKGNKDTVARQIISTGAQLKEVERALGGWTQETTQKNKEAFPWVENLRTTLANEWRGLQSLRDESNLRKFLDHEDEQARIKDIFDRINEARVQFELALNLRVYKAVYEINQDVRTLILKHLDPSEIAHHDYILEGVEGQLLRRQVCTPGTRGSILESIIMWAKDTSPDSPDIYWLFGHPGSGKSTIAYTIARRFEFAGDPSDTIILGGNFMCSRQFERTRLSKYIIRTIVYHLALKCKPFADALTRSGRLDTISQNLRTQLDGLLFGPWEESRAARLADPLVPTCYLIVIDALDEIDGTGGSDFLRDLVNDVNKSSKDRLTGLKFFVTSRSDPGLVRHVNALVKKQLYHLHEVKEEEANSDIKTYFGVSLPRVEADLIKWLVDQAAGLFIYAATVVKSLENLVEGEKSGIIRDMTKNNPSSGPVATLDRLYRVILEKAFRDFQGTRRDIRFQFLCTFLCAREPLSTITAAKILFGEQHESFQTNVEIADAFIGDLHAVLYVENDQVLSYHKSFPDFMFNVERSRVAEVQFGPVLQRFLRTPN